ncbi:MAG: presqualene diphosphate synthase HpnD [Gammaproteobacteria bacterium]|nr:presqualene diphosphate synthase HpnD [Gammaproteobacteria bacterium]NIR96554.1 presqualene diphosphate synthase HpnD [Gammaproteobacteria bacterium]NIT62292.1 presqualene diphosphate synthase HpnD [Gammaproteobacteria bacterium]NIV19196.1 presqualene diphosphate synthase HpnD [Gammaproteobacteria bacterium]NIX10064.1 presqualene diphosphate synthase HpnD [Gammaproteobacteria bacterium]
MTPDQYCGEKAAPAGSSLRYSLLWVPPPERAAVLAVHALRHELREAAVEVSDPGVAAAKLGWWREELDRLDQGTPRHPVTQALQAARGNFDLRGEYLQEILEGAETDLEQSRFESFKDLSLYCHRLSGSAGVLCAEIFGYEDHHTPRYAHALAVALQLTRIIRNVRSDAMRGRWYVPLEELQRFALRPADLAHPQTADRARDLFRFQVERARSYFQKALSQLPERDRFAQRAGLAMAAIYRTLLDEIERDGYRLLEHRIELTPLRKMWLAWRTVRRERRRHPARKSA